MSNETSAEFEIKVSGGRITNAQAHIMPDGKCKIVVDFELTTNPNQRGAFQKVFASELRFDDDFMKHEPKTKKEQKFKELLENVIKCGIKDFWAPKCAPSFNKAGTGICFEPGMAPATGKPFDWWKDVAENFAPFHKSRLGTKSEYIAFLAVLIKKLVASGWTVDDAWDAVCFNSKKLWHYLNDKYEHEDTSCEQIFGAGYFSNTYKFLADDNNTNYMWIAEGYIEGNDWYEPLFSLSGWPHHISGDGFCTGWIVLETDQET